jgi:hypothetical protein
MKLLTKHKPTIAEREREGRGGKGAGGGGGGGDEKKVKKRETIVRCAFIEREGGEGRR